MNKMAEEAKTLGVKMGREFSVRTTCEGIKTYKITEEGIWRKNEYSGEWDECGEDLYKLVIGKYEIIQKPWKAELNEGYYIPFPASPVRYQLIIHSGSKQDDEWYRDGLMCQTKEQAIEIAEAMINVARAMQGVDK